MRCSSRRAQGSGKEGGTGLRENNYGVGVRVWRGEATRSPTRSPQPNNHVQAMASSVRSCLAPASGRA